MERVPTPPPETTPSWAAGFRRRVPFYFLAAIMLALLAGALTFVYLDRLRAEAVPTGQALVARQPGQTIEQVRHWFFSPIGVRSDQQGEAWLACITA
ncbi:MAG: hypothetical protein GTO14_17980 [Anaerolineales bacterium]|nr:hypothetical protein [Anaerolineales bacterium]